MRRDTLATIIMAAVMAAASVAAAAQGMAKSKPQALPSQPGWAAPTPQQAPPQHPPASRARCAEPLMAGCMRMQSSCQMACPGLYSMNPSAPAFTPTDRAGCLARCGSQYRMCLIQYGCL